MTGSSRANSLQLGLAANAMRPVPSAPASGPGVLRGWLTAELAPHLLAATAADTAVARRPARRPHAARRARPGRGRREHRRLRRADRRRQAGRPTRSRTRSSRPSAATTGEVIARDPMPDDVPAPWPSLAMPFRMRNVDVTRHRRLPYAPGGRRFELDVYHHRDQPAGRPVLLQVHGGGWVIGNKDQQGIPLMLQMAARGWVCVAVNYPLSPRVRWPEHLDRASSGRCSGSASTSTEYGGDPSFVAVTGGSAGGHLAAMVGADRRRQVACSPASRTSTPRSRPACRTTASTTSPTRAAPSTRGSA